MTRENSPAGTAFVPLNIMCSSTCATPVTPLTSSTLPTLYQTMQTTTGARVSRLTIMRMPFGSSDSTMLEVVAAWLWVDAKATTSAAIDARNQRTGKAVRDIAGGVVLRWGRIV